MVGKRLELERGAVLWGVNTTVRVSMQSMKGSEVM
jgi:hypothetical protein